MAERVGSLVKRLLQANQIGVRFYQEDGHRWIQWLQPDHNESNDAINWHAMSYKYKVPLPCKVYGSVEDALESVDQFLDRVQLPCLLKMFEDTWGGQWQDAWGFPKGAQ